MLPWLTLMVALYAGGSTVADKFEEDNYGVKYASNCEGTVMHNSDNDNSE